MACKDDLISIQELLAAYGQLLDDLRFEEFGDLFCEDAVWEAGDFRFEGRDAIMHEMRKIEPPRPGMVRHLTFAPIVRVSGDEAHAWADAIALQVDNPSQIVAVGRYHDVLRREGDRWRIARRLFIYSGAQIPAGVRPTPGVGDQA